MKKLFLCSLILLAGSLVQAETLPFRSGIILAAELSQKAQKIRDFDAAAHPDLPPQNIIYASVTLTVFSGRVLSCFDYSISAFGKDYKCVALKTADGGWISCTEDINFPKEKEKYSMLFILDSRVVGLNDKEKLTLKCNYPPAKAAQTAVIFTNRRNNDFTRARQIPLKGILTVEK